MRLIYNKTKHKERLTPRRVWTLWGIGNLAMSAFMFTGINNSFIGSINTIFTVAFFCGGCWMLYCAYYMESGPHE